MATEKRLIDANELLKKFQFRLSSESLLSHSVYLRTISDCVQIARKIISEAPTVDAVEVVRCKDCTKKIWCEDERLYWCAECHYRCNDGEWYCAGGERKGDG